jgi:hypothetical protein
MAMVLRQVVIKRDLRATVCQETHMPPRTILPPLFAALLPLASRLTRVGRVVLSNRDPAFIICFYEPSKEER